MSKDGSAPFGHARASLRMVRRNVELEARLIDDLLDLTRVNRGKLQMVSEEGLNAYGASTWGQFFVYQGFNDKVGWMHTSSGVDATDEYLETVEKKDGRWMYKSGSEMRPVAVSEIAIPYKNGDKLAEKKFTVYRTHHGPIIRERARSGRGVSSILPLCARNAIFPARSPTWPRTCRPR